ncbi:MAG: LCP family protein [Oscillospiraceae bacterium]|nr:LCP family protein [Oscillospiraceae bacterium]
MKKLFSGRIPGLMITVLLTIAVTLFMAILIQTKLLPAKLLLLAGGIFLLFVLSVFLLTKDARRTGALITGSVMTMVLLITLMVGTPYLTKAVNTLGSMTNVNVEMADVGVYVKNDSSVQEVNELSGKTMGIMSVLDRANTDKALEEMQLAVATAEYAGISELADGLLSGEVDAIVLNNAFLDLLTETEGYENILDEIREIHTQKTETLIENVEDETKDKWNILDLFGNEDEEEQKRNDRVFTMYISGIDNRGGLIAKSRSDVNILATVNVDTRQVLLISTPRDFYVPLPISNGQPDKLTHAGIYGVDVSIGTLEMLYGVDIDYYFRVNFVGFEKIIDALGGITVHSDYAFSTSKGNFQKGENYLNGEQALSFARERKSFSEGDRQRGKNQMAVIKAVINKAMSPAILSSYADIMESVSGSFETSMPYDVIAELVRDMLDKGGSWNIVTYSVNGSGDTRKPYSMSTNAYVMIPNQETVDTAIEKINQVMNGEILE